MRENGTASKHDFAGYAHHPSSIEKCRAKCLCGYKTSWCQPEAVVMADWSMLIPAQRLALRELVHHIEWENAIEQEGS